MSEDTPKKVEAWQVGNDNTFFATEEAALAAVRSIRWQLVVSHWMRKRMPCDYDEDPDQRYSRYDVQSALNKYGRELIEE